MPDPVATIEQSLLDACVHCGFCLPTCPTYELWGEEMDSPRGRIVLIGELAKGAEPSAELTGHLDNCLGCMACVTACPSGVRYDLLLQDARPRIEQQRPRAGRVLRKAVFALFPHPGRLRALVPLMQAGRILPKRGPLKLAPHVPLRNALNRLPAHTPAAKGAPARGHVGFLQGCVQRVFFPDVNQATVAVLAAEGYAVDAPRRPACCGSLAQHAGERERARKAARQTIDAFDHLDTIVTNAAGCGSGMKEYGHLLRDDPAYAERAERFAAKVKDVTELLAQHEPHARRHPIAGLGPVVYHDACHLAHAQQVREQPRKLLRQIPGLELREPANSHRCCGSAGIYNLVKPEPAAELGERKAHDLEATQAAAVAAANPGCALQIAAYSDLPVHHPITLLHRSITGDR